MELEIVKKVNEYIEQQVANTLPPSVSPYRSEVVINLLEALSKAQGEFPPLTFNRKDAYFQEDFADFDAVVLPIRPILAKYGLCFMQQQQITDGGVTMLHTIIGHASGQWIESRNRILPATDNMMSYQSELMFQKRHALMAILGLSVTHDTADDNAFNAMKKSRTTVEKGTAINVAYENTSRDTITKEQLEELEYELAEYPDMAKMILDQWKLSALADMPKSKYLKAVSKIREIKLLRSGVKA